MAKYIWYTNLFATLLTAFVLVSTTAQSKPKRYEYVNPSLDEIFETDLLNRRAETHPLFLQLRNAAVPLHSGSSVIGSPNLPTAHDVHTNLDLRKTRRMISGNSHRGSLDQGYSKDGIIIFKDQSNGQHYTRWANRKSLAINDNNKNISAPHLSSKLPTNTLQGEKGPVKPETIPPPQVRGKREDISGFLQNLWSYQSEKTQSKWTWPTKFGIVFPDTSFSRPICGRDGQTYCTEVENYPAKHLEALLKRQPERYEQLFGDDVVPINVTQRIDIDEESLCGSKEELIYPKAGETVDQEWLYIINHGNYTQGVRVETCTNPGGKCAMTNNFPLGYKTECKQKYIYRQMLGFNAEGRVVKDLFHLPSCCKCVLKHAGAND